VREEDLERELLAIRRGAGARHVDIVKRVGPTLRQVCGIEPEDDYAVVVRKLDHLVGNLVGEMGETLLLVLRCELNLHQDCSSESLTARQAWLAANLHQGASTIRRMGSRAMRIAASVIANGGSRRVDRGLGPAGLESTSATDEFRLADLKFVLFSCPGRSRSFEVRRVLGMIDNLDSVTLGMTIPSIGAGVGAGSLQVEVQYGASLERVIQESRSSFKYAVRFPRSLMSGEVGEFAATIEVLGLSDVAPWYVLSPVVECDHFDLRIVFPLSAKPELVWVIEGESANSLYDVGEGWPTLSPDSLGEVHKEFIGLRPGRAYGFRWGSTADVNVGDHGPAVTPKGRERPLARDGGIG